MAKDRIACAAIHTLTLCEPIGNQTTHAAAILRQVFPFLSRVVILGVFIHLCCLVFLAGERILAEDTPFELHVYQLSAINRRLISPVATNRKCTPQTFPMLLKG